MWKYASLSCWKRNVLCVFTSYNADVQRHLLLIHIKCSALNMILFKFFTLNLIKAIDREFIKANLALRFHALLIFLFNFDVRNCSAKYSEDSQWPIDTQSNAIHYLMTQIFRPLLWACDGCRDVNTLILHMHIYIYIWIITHSIESFRTRFKRYLNSMATKNDLMDTHYAFFQISILCAALATFQRCAINKMLMNIIQSKSEALIGWVRFIWMEIDVELPHPWLNVCYMDASH